MNLDLGPAFTRAQAVVNGLEYDLGVGYGDNAPPKRADAPDARDKVLTAVKNQLSSHGIDLPFPTQQVLFHDQTEDSDGDCARQREGWPAGNRDVPVSRKVADAIRDLSGSKPRGAEGE